MENSFPAEPDINIGNLNGDANSGGLARWAVYAIIAVVAIIVIVAAVLYTKKKIQESREDGSIIKDVGEAITDDVDKKTADDLLEVAIRAQTESAQLNADMETAKQLFTLGQVSQADVDKAVAAAEASKTTAIQKNAEAAKALEAFRKKELSAANATVLEATKKATGLSQEYEKVSDGITEQKMQEANALLVDLVKKRQQAEADYSEALDTKNKAEAAFLESKKAKAANKRGVIATMNKKIADIKEKIKRAKITKPSPAPKPPAPKPPTPPPRPPTALEKKYPYWGWDQHAGLRCKNNNNSGCTTAYDKNGQLVDAEQPPAPAPKPQPPRPPTALERKYPYWGWDQHAGLRCKNNNNSGCTTAYDKNGQLVDAEQPPAPAPKPQPPRPPTALERKYPYWGWDQHAGLRCKNNNNTGCTTAYDKNGQLIDVEPAPAPAPVPSPSNRVISTLDLRSLMKGGGSWNIKKYKMLKSNLTQFNGEDVIRCWYGKNSGTSRDPGVGGFSFEAIPNGMNRDAIVFSWEVFYPRGFQFARGGKFGGVGIGYGAASGGNFSTTGASNRVMWQVDGGIIAYVYPPSGLWQKVPGLDAKGYGTGFFNRELAKALKTDSWNSISLGTKLNTFKNGVPQADGETSVTVNGKRMVQSGINWRRSEDLKISKFDIGTFFGGPTPSPVDQFCYFKNFQMSNY